MPGPFISLPSSKSIAQRDRVTQPQDPLPDLQHKTLSYSAPRNASFRSSEGGLKSLPAVSAGEPEEAAGESRSRSISSAPADHSQDTRVHFENFARYVMSVQQFFSMSNQLPGTSLRAISGSTGVISAPSSFSCERGSDSSMPTPRLASKTSTKDLTRASSPAGAVADPCVRLPANELQWRQQELCFASTALSCSRLSTTVRRLCASSLFLRPLPNPTRKGCHLVILLNSITQRTYQGCRFSFFWIMPGLAPISEVSSDTTRSEASKVSRDTQLEAIRKLRFGPHVGARTKVRNKCVAESSARTPTPMPESLEPQVQVQAPQLVVLPEMRGPEES